MPLFEFVCQDCAAEQELLVRGEDVPQCEKCGSAQLTKLLPVPAAHTTARPELGPPPGSCGTGCGCFPG